MPPPSLQNIYKELQADLGLALPGHGNLESWARQGVLLLNACLTVEDGAPDPSGQGLGVLHRRRHRGAEPREANLVFILCRKAQDKGAVIDRERALC